jgi:hypothetical protein
MKDVPKAIEAVWKIESTRLIAAIARPRICGNRNWLANRLKQIEKAALSA